MGKRMDVLWKTCGELDRRKTETAANSRPRLDSIPAGSRLSTSQKEHQLPFLHSFGMSKMLYGAAALIGTLLLFAGWLADYQRQAAVDRLEKWEAPHDGTERGEGKGGQK